jgi:hypothetical protein
MLIKNTQTYINHTLAKVAVTQLKDKLVVHSKKKNLFKSDHTLAKVAVTQLKDKVVVPNKFFQKSVP